MEVLESIAEEQGFSVRWEEGIDGDGLSSEERSFEDFEEVDMNEVL